ncbi:MAG: type II toxin-antitoxin system VapC family toxin [Phycisphaerales bacterium]
MPLVVDCSVAMTWCFHDEASAAADAMLQRLGVESGVVPGHWRLEVANTLLMGLRRKRLSEAAATDFLALLDGLPIETDLDTAAHAVGATLTLARTHGLTVYDAAYLELALRLGLPLATKDAALAGAATKAGVEVFAV